MNHQEPIDPNDSVHRAYHDAPRDEPPAALDDAIRAAARRAVQSRPQGAKPSFMKRWQVPLAAAASMVLAVSVLFVALDEHPDVLKSNQSPAAVSLPLERKVIPASPAPQFAQDARDADRQHAAASEEAASSQRATVEKKIARRVDAAQEPVFNEQKIIEKPVSARPAAPAPVAASELHNFAPAAPPPPEVTAGAAPAPLRAKAEAPASTPATAQAIVTSPATAQAMQRSEKIQLEMPAVQLAKEKSAPVTVSVTGSTAAPPVPAAVADKPQFVASPKTLADMRADSLGRVTSKMSAGKAADIEAPEPWIKRMQALREAGKLKELREELARFKKQYPAFTLPKALSELPEE